MHLHQPVSHYRDTGLTRTGQLTPPRGPDDGGIRKESATNAQTKNASAPHNFSKITAKALENP